VAAGSVSLPYWLSARLRLEWARLGYHGEVPRVLRRLQTIRLGRLHVFGAEAPPAK